MVHSIFYQSIVLGLTYSPVGLIIGIIVWYDAIGEGYFPLIFTSAAGAFISGFIFYYLVTRFLKLNFIKKGLLIGILAGFLSHPIVWYSNFLFANFCFHALGKCVSSLGEAPADLLSAIPFSFVFSFYSLLFFGWINIPVAIIIAIGFSKYIEIKQQAINN
jgi:hypothetical protein